MLRSAIKTTILLGALTGLEEYLHRRTGGMLGSLRRLVRGAAIQAVLDGTEAIAYAISLGCGFRGGPGRSRAGAPDSHEGGRLAAPLPESLGDAF